MEELFEGETKERKAIRWTIIIPVITLIIIAVVVVLIIVLTRGGKNSEDKDTTTCIKGAKEKCLTCNKDKCGSCNTGYKLVDGKCKEDFSFVSTYKSKSGGEKIQLFQEKYLQNVM